MSTAPAPRSEEPSPRDGSGEMFDAIADRYDLLNRIISLGVDQGWRRQTVEALQLRDTARVLDLATGTADLALMIARSHPGVRLDGVDPSRKMLEIGERKVAAAGLSERVRLTVGVAESLPFPDATFDGVTIAFGIRNVPDRPRALREMARVTRPGGRVAILELSEPRGGVLGPLARFHVHSVVPFVGGLLSGSKEYRYLQRSISAFPTPEAFSETMRQAGLHVLEARPLTFGVCHLYVAEPARPS
ncbi:MAG TPA: bifunctional demethylmenaquinone methyltransferase/2-methoxy-6-polyprenyl-1,4-benzoquinol methylase UbiE [Polyangiaceae bacterium]|nr:bifunctional demethylmenaquinone methyltransferase/2-methoxy-6-polyprenyl-1,4-benzoquinol methylase UbiE [Polyangiaceae bacterium]